MTKLCKVYAAFLILLLGFAIGKCHTVYYGIEDVVAISEYETEICIDGEWYVYMNEPIKWD